MFSYSAAVIFCLLVVLANHSRAWSEAGHIAIAELAQRQLPAIVQSKLRDYSAIVLAKTPERARWASRYSGFSATSYISAWPDTIRDVTVEELFSRYRTTVPAPLEHYRHDTTNNWHYTNRWYYSGQGNGSGQGIGVPAHCDKAYRFRNSGKLLPVIERLYLSFEQATSDAQRAVTLALLIHMLSDLHQPLHNFAGIGKDCRHDRGGNAFCLAGNAPDKCELSLHRWWDRGAGLFESPLDMEQIKKWTGTGRYKRSGEKISAGLISQQLKAWSDDSRQHASAVYSLEPGQMPDEQYTRRARKIVKQQTALAVERLGIVLLSLID